MAMSKTKSKMKSENTPLSGGRQRLFGRLTSKLNVEMDKFHPEPKMPDRALVGGFAGN
jgi:hypothetical protein